MSSETDLVKERLDLADLVGEYVQLKRAGRSYKGLCPFHQEKTPSFIVSPDKGIWHCFGCAEGGDAFTFLQKVEGLEFRDALKMLADRTGVTLPETPTGPSHDQRARLFELLQLAARFYHEILVNQSAGTKALAYLTERSVKADTIEQFEIGYAPNKWDIVQQYLQKKNYTIGDMVEAGLVGRNEQGRTFDRFRGRIMFPIHDVQGRVVGFGGRILPEHATGNEGKYINSPETRVYEKRRTVYNLHRAKKHLRRHEPCLVVEGYMDVVLLAQSGVANVVASSGTAFTPEQVHQLKRYTDVLHFAFDADNAGIQAAQAATREALQAGLRVATILFPAGQDPADVATSDPATLQETLTQPTPLTEMLLNRLKQTESAADRDAMLQDILPFVKMAGNPIQQGEMVQHIAAAVHVPESTIHEQLDRLTLEVTRHSDPEPDAAATPVQRITAAHVVLGSLIAQPQIRLAIMPSLDVEYLPEGQLRDLYEHVAKHANDELAADEFIKQLPENLQPLAEAIRQRAEEEFAAASQPLAEATKIVIRLKHAMIRQRLTDLQHKLTTATGEEHNAALAQFQALAQELASTGQNP